MAKPNPTADFRILIFALCILGVAGLACKSLTSLPGLKTNMFEGTTAQDGAAKIKAKVGSDAIKVSRMEIHEDRMSIVIQDPKKPKNFDEYTYEKGAVSGPKPVEALVLGNQEFTADKSRLFDLSEVNLGNIPEVCRKAAERAKIEDGKCENISVDWESASWTRTKEENDRIANERREALTKKIGEGKGDGMEMIRKSIGDLAVTWRVWIKGPRATKDFWVDAKGNVWDYH